MSKYVIYGSLWNFELERQVDQIQIGDFTLRRFNRVDVEPYYTKLAAAGLEQTEYNFLSTLLFLYRARPNRDFPHFILQTEISCTGNLDFQKADRKIKFFINALRLYKEGIVLGRLVSAIPKKDFRGEMIPIDGDSYPQFDNKYILSQPRRFKKFLKTVSSLSKLVDTIPFDRFYISFSRISSPVDQLIDLIISLEGLFNKSPFDIKYKVALRTSHLLYPKRSDKRHKIYLTITEAYNMRNKIVHGQGTVTQEELRSMNLKLEDIVRRVLKKSLEKRFKRKLNLFKKDLKEEKIDKVLING